MYLPLIHYHFNQRKLNALYAGIHFWGGTNLILLSCMSISPQYILHFIDLYFQRRPLSVSSRTFSASFRRFFGNMKYHQPFLPGSTASTKYLSYFTITVISRFHMVSFFIAPPSLRQVSYRTSLHQSLVLPLQNVETCSIASSAPSDYPGIFHDSEKEST